MVSELFSRGQRETAEEISARVGGGALSFQPLIRRIEAQLEA
jgi:hypothetical protein